MGRFTECSEAEWRMLTSKLEKRLAKEFRRKGWRGEHKIDMKTWRDLSKKALLTASGYALDDCNIDEIVEKTISEIKDKIPLPGSE